MPGHSSIQYLRRSLRGLHNSLRRDRNPRWRRIAPWGLDRLEDRTLLSAGDIDWMRQFGSQTPLRDTSQSAASDGSGSVYVGGLAAAALPGQTSAGGIDAY